MKPIVLCGPTASGKTELALELARQTDGIILSADSRQVYKRLTVGTAKPAGTWQNGAYRVDGVPYHLVDFLDVTDTFNAGAFKARAGEIIQKNPGRQIIFAGGTGMYLHAFFVGMDELPQSTPQTREMLQKLLAEHGKEGLHNALQEKDPASAAAIPAGNVQRTMRALELCLLTGKPASELKSGNFFKLPDENASQWVYLDWAKEALHARINLRTDQIFDGMAEEARTLLTEGYAEDVPALKSLGYPQAIAFLKGELARKDAVERVTTLTRQYAKRQRTWFNRYTNALRIALEHPADFDAKKIARDILSRAGN
ncbi:MAG: tRNA (adenosine(37)-N6)-dimethylallyltransferase MiaA [Elusimicrobia bacterium]|nr:tRNA (adenosine(37)-N6)-dimethylallyltransferase MiaA [Elusimicrobiota bacterium]MDY6039008.1 tRNA (adenosine(37)-N6)-dimethylallyltransferase MiaA [Elusimicrobiaceae bacterium]